MNETKEVTEAVGKANSREALFGFAAWLTTREKEITLGAHQASCAEMVDLLVEWADFNALPPVTDSYPKNIRHPKKPWAGWTKSIDELLSG